MNNLRIKSFLLSLSLIAILIILLSNQCPAEEPGQIVLRWTSAPNAGSESDANRYIIKYSLFPITESNWGQASAVENTLSQIPAGSAQEITISGLEPGRKYYIAMKTSDNANNTSALSSVVTSYASGIMTPEIIGAKINSAGLSKVISHPVESYYSVSYQFALDMESSFENQTIISTANSDSCVILPQQILVNESKYYLRCRAMALDHSDSSNWSRVESFIISPNLLSKKETDNQIPTEYYLAQSYPNPFNPSATIGYGLPADAQVRITIYDILGRAIQTLVNERQTAGYHQITWNAGSFPSGTYLYRIQAGDYSASKKMQLLK
jgi:hypothetical protein